MYFPADAAVTSSSRGSPASLWVQTDLASYRFLRSVFRLTWILQKRRVFGSGGNLSVRFSLKSPEGQVMSRRRRSPHATYPSSH